MAGGNGRWNTCAKAKNATATVTYLSLWHRKLHFGIALQVLVRITPLRDIRVDGDGVARGTDTIDRSRNTNG